MSTNEILNSAFAGLQLKDQSNAQRVSELLDQFDLRWKVSKEKLFLPDGTKTQYHAIVREDNRQVFQTCKDSYVPYQNSELAELLITIADRGGYAIHSGGSFNGGAKVYTQLSSGNSIKGIGINNDRVDGFVTGINSHDGSISLKWGSSNITISCKNTFVASAKQLSNSARHTNNMIIKVDQYLKLIDGAIEQEKSIFDKFIKLADAPVKQKHITKVVQNITGVDIELDSEFAKDKFSTYSINRAEELLASIQREILQKGQTLWGLMSGVTNYTTHTIPVAKRDNARLESKYVGIANNIDNEAFALIGSFVN
jgi:hypothetical protein